MPFFRLTHCNHYVATLLSTGFSYPITSPYFLCKYFVCRREFPPDGNIGGRRKLLPPQDLNNRAINIYMAFLYHKQKACQVFFCIFVGEGLVPSHLAGGHKARPYNNRTTGDHKGLPYNRPHTGGQEGSPLQWQRVNESAIPIILPCSNKTSPHRIIEDIFSNPHQIFLFPNNMIVKTPLK